LTLSIRTRLIIGFLGASVLVGGVSLWVGSLVLYRAVVHEAGARVGQDLNAARELYHDREQLLQVTLSLLAGERDFVAALRRGDSAYISRRFQLLAGATGADFVGVVGSDGHALARLGGSPSGPRRTNPVAALALGRGAAVSGTVLLEAADLAAESPLLAERARIPIVATPQAAPRTDAEETDGLAIAAAVPLEDFEPPAVLYAGVLLSRNEEIVDRIRETVFRGETWRGQAVGAATIFFRDLRISTNVPGLAGGRAIGTRLSQEVKRLVLEEGKRWVDRAWVVDDWYLSAYEPIDDVLGRRVGVLYVGTREAPYREVRRRAMLVFASITFAGVFLAIALGDLLGMWLLRPVRALIAAAHRVANGDLDAVVGAPVGGEIGVLQRTFADMVAGLRHRDASRETEREHQLAQSEKQASVGRLAAGIAHEINNPLTGVLTFTHMLLRRGDLDGEARRDLETIAQSTERVRTIVKGLLDFARQTRLAPEPADVNEVVAGALSLAANQGLLKGVRICFDPAPGLPAVTLDRNQVQSVVLNLLLNALDATEQGGHVNVATCCASDHAGTTGVEIEVADTGCGISPEHLERVFDPFFTTKEVGRGTGLGLSVSLGIVGRHGGAIRVHSRPGQGSTFTVWLPLAREG
jgi:two-component system NtrC family sensor kinase